MWREARKAKNENIRLERIRNEVTDIQIQDKQIKVYLQKSPDFVTDKIVFALGNLLPQNPPVKNKDVLSNKHYLQNPWQPEILDKVAKNDTLLFSGTGQTMVDLGTGLHRRNHRGKMIAISRRGVFNVAEKS